MNQIVCLSTSPWHPIPTRKQQVMSRLTDAEILYFDPPVTCIAPLKDPMAKPKMTAYRAPGENIRENLTVYALPPVLPLFNKYRAINRRNQKKIAAFVRQKMAEHGVQNPILWTYSPTSADLLDEIPHRGLVYDCVDRHSAYGGLMNPALVDAMELELAGRADQVFVTASGLQGRLAAVNRHCALIPNGCGAELFAKAAEPQMCPGDLEPVEGPIFGFVGALQSCIEYGYVLSAAKARPQWQFVFLGAEKPGVDLSALRALKNVHFLGMKPHDSLPQYISCFSACLNLFDDSDLSRDVSPLKFYEYLATGKPIVSTAQPEQVLEYRDLIHIARTEQEFLSCCEAALADTDPARREARMEQGRLCSWDARVAEMRAVLTERGLF